MINSKNSTNWVRCYWNTYHPPLVFLIVYDYCVKNFIFMRDLDVLKSQLSNFKQEKLFFNFYCSIWEMLQGLDLCWPRLQADIFWDWKIVGYFFRNVKLIQICYLNPDFFKLSYITIIIYIFNYLPQHL